MCYNKSKSKLQDGEMRDIELVDNSGNRNVIKLAIDWKQKQEENMQSNIKYYTSLEMVEKIKNGFGRKIDDGSVQFDAECDSTIHSDKRYAVKHLKYFGGNFYSYAFPDGLRLLPVDTVFGICEPAFKPIQPKIVNIDFHGVILPIKESSITGKDFIACDSSGAVAVYDGYPTVGTGYFLSKSHGKCEIIANIKYEGDWTQSCTEIKLVEVE